jgi:hypothetical protein
MNDRFPDLPAKMRSLPVDHRGFPVPWFVAWVNGEPQFPVADARKFGGAINHGLCWVCGGALGRLHAFVIGPMCVINRTTGEPPCHPECARFSARNCPFLTKPRMKRVGEQNLPCGTVDGAGIAIKRNPGCAAVWVTRGKSWKTFSDGSGGYLINLGNPYAIEWYALGVEATREQVMDSINSGLPILEEMVAQDDDPTGAAWELEQRKAAAWELLPS